MGGGPEAVAARHPDGRGAQVPGEKLHRTGQPDAGGRSFPRLQAVTRSSALTRLLLSPKDPGGGGGAAEVGRGRRLRRGVEAAPVAEGRVLVVCADLGAAGDLDLQSGL